MEDELIRKELQEGIELAGREATGRLYQNPATDEAVDFSSWLGETFPDVPTENATMFGEFENTRLFENAMNEGYATLETSTPEFIAEIPTINFSETVYNEFGNVVSETLRPMEIVNSAEEAEVLRGWASVVSNIFPQAWREQLIARMPRLGGYRIIELVEENGFTVEAEAEGVVASLTRRVMSQIPLWSIIQPEFVMLLRGASFVFNVIAVAQLIEEYTGFDPFHLNVEKNIKRMRDNLGGLEVKLGGVSARDQLNRSINKLNAMRMTLNRVYNAYYVLVDKQPFTPALREIKILEGDGTGAVDYDPNTVMDYLGESGFNLGWCDDPLLLKRIDDRITMVRNFSPYTDNPATYTTGWTIEDRKAWEKEAFKIIYDMIRADSNKIAEELDYRKDKIGDTEKKLTEDLLFQTFPTSLAFWSLIWSCKAYSDPKANFADLLLKGFAPFKNFDFDDKPIDTTMDFITEEVESSWGWQNVNWWLSATLAYSPSQDIMYVAFRGTDFNQMNAGAGGWINFIKNAILDAKGLTYKKKHLEGIDNHTFEVYDGWYDGFMSMKDKVLQRLSFWQTIYNPREVIFTGHSLGSALAQVAMVDKDTSNYATAYIGFGTPRVFTPNDVDVYNKHWGFRSWRFNNTDDAVSYIPFPMLGFSFTGKGVLMDRETRKVATIDGDYRFKKFTDYLKNIPGMNGHTRMAYLNSMCDIEIPRPANVPALLTETASATRIMELRRGITDQQLVLSDKSKQGIYLRSCAYKAFLVQAKLNKPLVVLGLLRLFLEFGKLDLNVDGTLDKEEYERHKTRLRGRRLPEEQELPMPDFDFMDMNGDGLITFKEYLTQSIKLLTGETNIIPLPPKPSIDVEAVKILGLAILPPRTSSNLVEYLVLL